LKSIAIFALVGAAAAYSQAIDRFGFPLKSQIKPVMGGAADGGLLHYEFLERIPDSITHSTMLSRLACCPL
jgi:uncharacterized membrane protein YeiH